MKFKKSISLALVMCMVLSLFASFVVSAEEAAEVTNIAKGKEYTITDQFRQGGKEVNWGWDPNAAVVYPDEGGTLTDGVFDPGDNVYTNAVWAGFNHTTPSYKDAEYPNHKITVDLGAVTDIQGAAIYLATSTLGNGIDYTYSFVSVNVSDDGETWTTLDSIEIGDDVVTDANYAKVSFDKAGTGRYVQFRLARSGWLFVSEVEVYGISSAEEEPEEVTVLGVDRVNHYDWTNKDFASEAYAPTAASAGEVLMAVSANGKTVAELIGGNWFEWWYKILAKWDAEKELFVISVVDAAGGKAYEGWTLNEGDIVIMCNTGYASTEPAGNADDAAVIKALVVGDTLALNKTTWETLSASSGALDGVYLTVNAPALEPVVPEEPEEPETPALSAEVVLPEGTGIAVPTGYGAIDVIVDGDNGLGVIDGYENFKAQLYTLRNGTTDVESTYSIKLTLEEAAWFDAVTVNMLSYTNGNVGLPKAITVVVGDNSYDAVVAGEDKAIANIVVELGEAVKASEVTINVTMNSGAVKYNMFSEIGVSFAEPAPAYKEGLTIELPETVTVLGGAALDVVEAGLVDGNWGAGSASDWSNASGIYCLANGVCKDGTQHPEVVLVGNLGEVTKLNTIELGVYSSYDVMIGYPANEVAVYVSEDGYEWTLAETVNLGLEAPAKETAGSVKATATLSTAVETQYIKLVLTYPDSPFTTDGKVVWEFMGLTEIALTLNVPEEVEGGDLPAHNPRVNGALTVPANTAISYTVAFENGANFSLYDETVTVLVNGEALEFGMLGYATTLAKGDVVTIVNEGAEAVELYPSISEVVFGTMGNPIVLEELGDIVANVTEAIISDSGAVHYEYTATVNGTLTITMPEGNWTYTVNNLTTYVYGDSQWSDSDPVLSTYTIDVAEGDLIQIIVGTYDPENPWGAPTGEIAFNVVEEATPVVPEDSKEIVDDAFALESGAELPYTATLTGKIVKINTPYNEQYGNISVTIEVEGTDGVKELLCYRIKGEGADTLAVGDTITVTGTIINYNGTIEYAAGSTIDAIEKGEGEVPVAPEDPKEIVDEAFGLEEGAALPYNATLTGVIVSVDTEYSDSYKNVTVSIEVEGTDGLHVIQCYRLKGDGADVIGVGDTITVTGVIKNYRGKIEFDSGCTLDSYVKYVPEYNEVIIDVNENAILTDGKTGFTGNWGEVGTTDVLLISNGECKNMAMQVVLNYALGETKTINGLVLDFYHCAGVMIGYPEGQILVEVSVDGENWTKVGLFDLAAAELATTVYGTVATTCEFDAVEAAYVKATFVVGSSTGVLGDSPADGKVFWEFASLAEVAVNEAKTTVTGNFAEEGLNGVNQFAANAHNIWTGSVASIEWWTKALLQWNDEAQGWEVLKVQGNGKVDWVTEGNQIVIAAHAENAVTATIASLQVGDIVYIWDIGVATSDKLSADVDCNGGFYTTDATKVGTTAFTYKEKVALAGDVNMDGVINDADYMIIRKLVVGTADAADYTAEQLALADVNGNGVIDANDYLVVKRHALGTYVIPAWR